MMKKVTIVFMLIVTIVSEIKAQGQDSGGDQDDTKQWYCLFNACHCKMEKMRDEINEMYKGVMNDEIIELGTGWLDESGFTDYEKTELKNEKGISNAVDNYCSHEDEKKKDMFKRTMDLMVGYMKECDNNKDDDEETKKMKEATCERLNDLCGEMNDKFEKAKKENHCNEQ